MTRLPSFKALGASSMASPLGKAKKTTSACSSTSSRVAKSPLSHSWGQAEERGFPSCLRLLNPTSSTPGWALSRRISSPPPYPSLLQKAGAFFTYDPKEAASGAHALYTDVWTSMGQEEEREKRLRDFNGFQVNGELLRLLRPKGIFLHCLPAHYGEETTEEAVHGPRSRVFDQAENRLHTAKAVLLCLLS